MLETIEKIVSGITGKTGLTEETDFVRDLALNSFDIMNIICAFEETYSITIPTRDVWKLRQVKDVIRYLQEKGVGSDSSKKVFCEAYQG